MKRLGLITLLAAIMTLGLTVSLPASAEAQWRGGGQHHQGQGWRQGGGPGYHNQGYHRQVYRNQAQGYGRQQANWANAQNQPQRPRHNPAPSWCPYR